MALDATPGGPASNAYCDVATATTLLEERLHTDAWDAATPEDQATSLIWATRLLDDQVRWFGSPATTTQALGWPRTGVSDPMGRPIDPAIVPVDIQRATATYALALLSDTSGTTPGVAAGTIKRTRLGETDIEYFQPGSGQTVAVSPVTRIPSEIRQMLRFYGIVSGGVSVPLIRT